MIDDRCMVSATRGERVDVSVAARLFHGLSDPTRLAILLQLLDASRMTHDGKRQSAQFWVENAVPDWNESETPFHTVARLTLQKESILPDDACQAAFISAT